MFKQKNTFFVTGVCGAVTSAMGCVVLIGWLFNIPELVRIQPGWVPMVVGTALCFVLSGLALLHIALVKGRPSKYPLPRILACLVLVIAGLHALEMLLDISLGIDLPQLHAPLQIDVHPGRIAFNTAVGFIVFAYGLLIYCRAEHSHKTSIRLRFMASAVFLIGLISVMGYWLKLEVLYNWAGIIRIAFHTGLGMTCLGVGLWSLWIDAPWREAINKEWNEAQTINHAAAVVLTVVTLCSGLAGFAILQDRVEHVVRDNLKQLAQDRREFFHQIVQHRLERATVASNTLQFLGAMGELSAHRLDPATLLTLRNAMKPMLDHGFTGIMLQRDGKRAVLAGEMLTQQSMAIKLHLSYPAELLWHNGFYLRAWIPLTDSVDANDYLVSEQPLPLLTKMATEKIHLGKTGEVVICHQKPANLLCFPRALHAQPFMIPKNIAGLPLPMMHAFEGQAGVTVAHDFRGAKVIAAYGPLVNTGLGMVLKIELSEIYAPLREQFQLMLPFIATMLVMGLWWMRKEIQPLALALVTSRKDLEASSKWRTAILESAAFSVISTDTHGKIISINRSGQRMLGYTEDELVQRQNLTILHGKDDLIARAHTLGEELGYTPEIGFEVLVAKARKGIVDEYEWCYVRKNGSRFPAMLSITALKDTRNEIFGFLAIAYDLTDRKKVERMKNEFISTVSHELRTPLTSIRGSLGLLIGGAVGVMPERAHALLSIANNNCERLVRLINDILDIEKIESGNMNFDFVIQPLQPLVEQAIAATQAFADQFHVNFIIESEINENEGYVNGDTDRLTQVVVNLLSNAAKFSYMGSPVKVRVSQVKNRVRFSVINYGRGIAEEFRGRIFEKFMQADSSDTRQKGGTGLGLNISKAIIEQHGGQMDFVSEPGVQTEFYFEMPAATPKRVTASTVKAPASQVLICEDNEDIAKLLSIMLAQDGFTSDIVGTAAQARQKLTENTYQAMTLDLALPGEDGLSLLRWLREEEKTRTLPVVIVSAKEEDKEHLIRNNLSVMDWLTKPIDEARLVKTLHSSLKPDSALIKPLVLHVEDDMDLVQVVATLLHSKCRLEHAATLAQARKRLEEEDFNAIILDLVLPDGNGANLLGCLPARNANTPIMIFSGKETDNSTFRNVCAILVKSRSTNEQLVSVLYHVLDIPKEITKDSDSKDTP